MTGESGRRRRVARATTMLSARLLVILVLLAAVTAGITPKMHPGHILASWGNRLVDFSVAAVLASRERGSHRRRRRGNCVRRHYSGEMAVRLAWPATVPAA
jgi:hypothetical protein